LGGAELSVKLLVYIFVFWFGAVWGSFLNVCIYRLPRGLSPLEGRSFCPFCGTQIRSYDSIPLLSFLILRGRCRSCRAPISRRYPLVEALAGFLAVFFFWLFPPERALLNFLFASCLLVISFIDFEHQIIPSWMCAGGMLGGVLVSLFGLGVPLKESIFGIFTGIGVLFTVRWLYELLRKEEGLGEGDLELMAFVGAFLGVKGALFAVWVGFALGGILGLILTAAKKAERKSALPFGPFLALGAFIYAAAGEGILSFWRL